MIFSLFEAIGSCILTIGTILIVTMLYACLLAIPVVVIVSAGKWAWQD